jgi:hypothetical protein
MSTPWRMHLAGFFLALAPVIIWPAAAHAATIIDDSASQLLEPSVIMRWQTPTPGRRGSRADDQLSGIARVRVRLDLAPWSTQGRFSSGQLRSGNRLLVYAGPIESPVFEELFEFQFSVDGRLLDGAARVTYHFEMDED